MSEAFDVFFHQKAIPDYLGITIYENNSADELLISCEGIYSRVTGSSFSPMEEQKVVKQLQNSQKNRNYLEIQFFHVQLNEEALLEELKELFPQFLWTKMSEEIEAEFSTYACEFIPIALRDESFDTPICFNVIESLQQMKGGLNESISEMLEKHLDEILSEDDDSGAAAELSFPVNVTVDEIPEEDDDEYELIATNRKSRKRRKNPVALPAVSETSENALTRTEESEIVYLKESLKREKASKERVRVAKEKLEHELLAIENSLLVSGLKRFKKHRKITVDEEDWYKPVKIDLIHYDDLYKKAKFIEQSWELNKELVTITEKMIVTKGELTYERERVERIKNSVSEMDLQSMMEQCHLINNRVRINRGFMFIKPSVKLYQIDYEQLEKISGFFDVIQTENRLLEQIILNQDNDNN